MRASNKESRNAGSPLPHFLVSFFPDSKSVHGERSAFVNRADSLSEIEGKAARVAVSERRRERVSNPW